jgi:hypothetical protein
MRFAVTDELWPNFTLKCSWLRMHKLLQFCCDFFPSREGHPDALFSKIIFMGKESFLSLFRAALSHHSQQYTKLVNLAHKANKFRPLYYEWVSLRATPKCLFMSFHAENVRIWVWCMRVFMRWKLEQIYSLPLPFMLIVFSHKSPGNLDAIGAIYFDYFRYVCSDRILRSELCPADFYSYTRFISKLS